MKRLFLLVTASLAGASCTTRTETDVVRGTAADHGHVVFGDPSASSSPLNKFSCATCHAEEGVPSDRLFPGVPLGGSPTRPLFWGGQENDLLTSVNGCRFYFMQARDAWTPDDEEAKALYAYLESLPPTSTGPVPFTVRAVVVDLPPGDAAQGASVYQRACHACHGELHTGKGRITTSAPALPEQTLADHASYGKDEQRLIFVEKVRHGGFLGYGGIMPPFSLEALSDADLGALLSYLGLYTP